MTTAELSVWATFAATAVTALATGVLAWVTWLLFQATRRMASATTEPNVVVTIEPNRWSFIHLDLHIENTGSGPAYDVQLAFEPHLMRDRHGAAKKLPLNAISVLRPSQSLRNFIGNGADLLQSTFEVTISWKASPNAKLRAETKYTLALSHYQGLVQLGGGDPAVSLAQEAKKIREIVEKISRGPGRVAINVFDQTDRDREEAEQEAWLREQEQPKPQPTQRRRRAK